jgi:hypothetical protein
MTLVNWTCSASIRRGNICRFGICNCHLSLSVSICFWFHHEQWGKSRLYINDDTRLWLHIKVCTVESQNLWSSYSEFRPFVITHCNTTVLLWPIPMERDEITWLSNLPPPVSCNSSCHLRLSQVLSFVKSGVWFYAPSLSCLLCFLRLFYIAVSI